ncbi:MAG: hypothetical protein LBK75_03805 [Oscillospiraceae bacterium]|nr:hypothetical protein [Oscillospiraceae bacterium]
MEREKILKHALRHSQEIDFKKAGSDSEKRSLFGLLHSLLQAANKEAATKGIPLQNHREVLEKVLKLPDGKRYMGLKTIDIKYLVETLFGKSGSVLDKVEFKGYDHDDLIAYLEVCRRMFFSKYKTSQKSILIGTEESKFEKPKWSFEGFKILKIQEDLEEKNLECARFVLEHRNECQKKKLLELAEKIIKAQH